MSFIPRCEKGTHSPMKTRVWQSELRYKRAKHNKRSLSLPASSCDLRRRMDKPGPVPPDKAQAQNASPAVNNTDGAPRKRSFSGPLQATEGSSRPDKLNEKSESSDKHPHDALTNAAAAKAAPVGGDDAREPAPSTSHSANPFTTYTFEETATRLIPTQVERKLATAGERRDPKSQKSKKKPSRGIDTQKAPTPGAYHLRQDSHVLYKNNKRMPNTLGAKSTRTQSAASQSTSSKFSSKRAPAYNPPRFERMRADERTRKRVESARKTDPPKTKGPAAPSYSTRRPSRHEKHHHERKLTIDDDFTTLAEQFSSKTVVSQWRQNNPHPRTESQQPSTSKVPPQPKVEKVRPTTPSQKEVERQATYETASTGTADEPLTKPLPPTPQPHQQAPTATASNDLDQTDDADAVQPEEDTKTTETPTPDGDPSGSSSSSDDDGRVMAGPYARKYAELMAEYMLLRSYDEYKKTQATWHPVVNPRGAWCQAQFDIEERCVRQFHDRADSAARSQFYRTRMNILENTTRLKERRAKILKLDKLIAETTTKYVLNSWYNSLKVHSTGSALKCPHYTKGQIIVSGMSAVELVQINMFIDFPHEDTWCAPYALESVRFLAHSDVPGFMQGPTWDEMKKAEITHNQAGRTDADIITPRSEPIDIYDDSVPEDASEYERGVFSFTFPGDHAVSDDSTVYPFGVPDAVREIADPTMVELIDSMLHVEKQFTTNTMAAGRGADLVFDQMVRALYSHDMHKHEVAGRIAQWRSAYPEDLEASHITKKNMIVKLCCHYNQSPRTLMPFLCDKVRDKMNQLILESIRDQSVKEHADATAICQPMGSELNTMRCEEKLKTVIPGTNMTLTDTVTRERTTLTPVAGARFDVTMQGWNPTPEAGGVEPPPDLTGRMGEEPRFDRELQPEMHARTSYECQDQNARDSADAFTAIRQDMLVRRAEEDRRSGNRNARISDRSPDTMYFNTKQPADRLHATPPRSSSSHAVTKPKKSGKSSRRSGRAGRSPPSPIYHITNVEVNAAAFSGAQVPQHPQHPSESLFGGQQPARCTDQGQKMISRTPSSSSNQGSQPDDDDTAPVQYQSAGQAARLAAKQPHSSKPALKVERRPMKKFHPDRLKGIPRRLKERYLAENDAGLIHITKGKNCVRVQNQLDERDSMRNAAENELRCGGTFHQNIRNFVDKMPQYKVNRFCTVDGLADVDYGVGDWKGLSLTSVMRSIRYNKDFNHESAFPAYPALIHNAAVLPVPYTSRGSCPGASFILGAERTNSQSKLVSLETRGASDKVIKSFINISAYTGAEVKTTNFSALFFAACCTYWELLIVKWCRDEDAPPPTLNLARNGQVDEHHIKWSGIGINDGFILGKWRRLLASGCTMLDVEPQTEWALMWVLRALRGPDPHQPINRRLIETTADDRYLHPLSRLRHPAIDVWLSFSDDNDMTWFNNHCDAIAPEIEAHPSLLIDACINFATRYAVGHQLQAAMNLASTVVMSSYTILGDALPGEDDTTSPYEYAIVTPDGRLLDLELPEIVCPRFEYSRNTWKAAVTTDVVLNKVPTGGTGSGDSAKSDNLAAHDALAARNAGLLHHTSPFSAWLLNESGFYLGPKPDDAGKTTSLRHIDDFLSLIRADLQHGKFTYVEAYLFYGAMFRAAANRARFACGLSTLDLNVINGAAPQTDRSVLAQQVTSIDDRYGLPRFTVGFSDLVLRMYGHAFPRVMYHHDRPTVAKIYTQPFYQRLNNLDQGLDEFELGGLACVLPHYPLGYMSSRTLVEYDLKNYVKYTPGEIDGSMCVDFTDCKSTTDWAAILRLKDNQRDQDVLDDISAVVHVISKCGVDRYLRDAGLRDTEVQFDAQGQVSAVWLRQQFDATGLPVWYGEHGGMRGWLTPSEIVRQFEWVQLDLKGDGVTLEPMQRPIPQVPDDVLVDLSWSPEHNCLEPSLFQLYHILATGKMRGFIPYLTISHLPCDIKNAILFMVNSKEDGQYTALPENKVVNRDFVNRDRISQHHVVGYGGVKGLKGLKSISSIAKNKQDAIDAAAKTLEDANNDMNLLKDRLAEVNNQAAQDKAELAVLRAKYDKVKNVKTDPGGDPAARNVDEIPNE